MKRNKKVLVLLLSLAMILTSINVAAFAENTASNLSATVSATEVNVGDTFTVTVKNSAMSVSSFTGGIGWDKTKVEYVSFAGGVEEDTTKVYLKKTSAGVSPYAELAAAEGENSNTFGMYITAGTETAYDAGTLCTITFKALASGDAGLYLYENSAGTNGYANDSISVSKVTVTSDESSTVAFTVSDGISTKNITVAEVKAATKVSETWSYKNGAYTVEADFYKLSDILTTAGITVDTDKIHGITATATDGFVTGFDPADLDSIYVFTNGTRTTVETSATETFPSDGSYATAVKDSAGNKWASGIATIAVVDDCVMFVKKGACKHYCAICGKTEATTKEEVEFAEDYQSATITVTYKCGGTASFTASVEEGTITSETTSAATCTEEGLIVYTATAVDGTSTYTCTEEVKIDKLGHTMSHFDAKNASFDEEGKVVEGNVEYYYCETCKKYFADEDGKKELAEDDVFYQPQYKTSSVALDSVEVTDELAAAGYSDAASVEKALEAKAIAGDGYKAENSVCYDVTLLMSLDNGKTYVECTADNFPAEGVKVLIPYSDIKGADKNCDFVITHMFAEDVNGHKTGEIEVVKYEKTDEGLACTFTGLSPICIAWKEAATADNKTAGSTTKTGDDSNMVIWIVIAALAAAGAATAAAYRRRKNG